MTVGYLKGDSVFTGSCGVGFRAKTPVCGSLYSQRYFGGELRLFFLRSKAQGGKLAVCPFPTGSRENGGG